MDEFIEIEKLDKKYDDLVVFENFSVRFQKQMVNCILGPSGCGKSTLLKIMAGLVEADNMQVMGAQDIEYSFIFEEPRLLPWKTALENVLLVLKQVDNGGEIAAHYLKMVGLGDFLNYYPNQLSGGMKQRVSIARAYAYPSNVILMDEPFKALDIRLKYEIINAVKLLWREKPKTMVYVTHDIDEAIALGQHIFVLSNPPARVIGTFAQAEYSDEALKGKLLKLIRG